MDSIHPPEPHTRTAINEKMRRDTNLWRGQSFQALPVLRSAIEWDAFLESVFIIGTPYSRQCQSVTIVLESIPMLPQDTSPSKPCIKLSFYTAPSLHILGQG